MASLEELRSERLSKLQKAEESGKASFPAKISLVGELMNAKTVKESLKEGEAHSSLAIVAGRVMSKRGQGKIMFVDIADESDTIQTVFKIDTLAETEMIAFAEMVDLGDFIAVSGTPFITQRGEKSVEVKEWELLTKALLPMPSAHFGLENEEEAMRKRYLGFALDPGKRDLFYKKAKFWKVVRNFLDEKGFLEVETPTLETTTGGAEARPFKTYHNDFNMDVYMRICIGELWQKRLMAGGFAKTYEIGRAYRNEGSSPEHLQEFTNCEFYMAYADYKDGMKLVCELYRKIALEVFDTTKFEMKGHTFDLGEEWKEIDYADEIKNQTGIDIWGASDEDIKAKLTELHVKYDGENRERLTDTLWKYCRKNISGPAFLVNHPLLVAPLAKPRDDGKTAQVFQPIFAGSEVGRGYSELNDPRIQRTNFEQQQELLDAGDEEAMMPDYEFVEMLEHGMPPTCGFGFGDRLFAFLSGLPIRETQLFPLVKPKESNS
jgi:lysyl-tRNA synthetase class 2